MTTSITNKLNQPMNRKQRRKLNRQINKLPRRQSTPEFKQFIKYTEIAFESLEHLRIRTSLRDTIVESSSDLIKFNESFISEMFYVESPLFKITITPKNKGVYLHKIQVNKEFQGQGLGEYLMGIIKFISNYLTVPVYLVPIPFGDDLTYSEQTKKLNLLQSWYKRLGFENPSNSKHWIYTPEGEVNETLNELSLAA